MCNSDNMMETVNRTIVLADFYGDGKTLGAVLERSIIMTLD